MNAALRTLLDLIRYRRETMLRLAAAKKPVSNVMTQGVSATTKKQKKLKKDELPPKPPKKVSAATNNKRLKEYSEVKMANMHDGDQVRWSKEFSLSNPFLYVSYAAGQTPDIVERAKNILLKKFIEKSPPENLRNKNVDIFNWALFGYAERGDYDELQNLINIMKANNVKINLRTISACLIAAETCRFAEPSQKADYVKDTLQWADKLELNVKKILFSSVYGLEDSRKIVSAVRFVDKHFTPNFSACKTEYDNKYDLLKGLNEPQSKEKYSDDGPYANIPNLASNRLFKNLEIQMKREKIDIVEIPSIVKLSHATAKDSERLETLFRQWRNDLSRAFACKLKELELGSNKKTNEKYILPFLTSIDSKKIIDIMFNFACNIDYEAHTKSVSAIKHDLGKKLFHIFWMNVQVKNEFDKKIVNIYREYLNYFDHSDLTRTYNQRNYWLVSAKQCYPHQFNVKTFVPPWNYEALLKIGGILFEIVQRTIKLPSGAGERPSFYVSHFGSGKRLREEIRVHDTYFRLIRDRNSSNMISMASQDCPMICPPIPWLGLNDGYFSFKPITMVRTPDEFMKYSYKVLNAVKKYKYNNYQQLFPAMDALNQLSAVPWKINGRILDVAVEIFQTGKGGFVKSLDIPKDPRLMKEPIPSILDDKVQRRKERREYTKKRLETFGLWKTVLYRLSIASFYRNDVLWFPHNFDFRGRVYPVPPHLNHMGDDLCRGLLQFAKGRKLGKDGLDWLKLHCINLTELKKGQSNDERLKHFNEVKNDVLDSADDPLHGQRWWTRFDKPWLILATCFEIVNAMRHPEGPENYVCHFPIHQDGCCNGLQHYAALGRDQLGAEKVNLTKQDRPVDVYNAVLDLVKERIEHDCVYGKDDDKERAILLKDIVVRKTIKQTVMTICYGVTTWGAKAQIYKQLKDNEKLTKNEASACAKYLTNVTFKSIGKLFANSQKIQKWLEKSAKLLSAECKQPVQWITPLGFPVLQPYFKASALKKSQPIRIVGDKASYANADFPLSAKQKQAFPPNFVHSLDSTHMMMTALNCQHQGVTYASVHDCYWTHPDTVNVMNKICREQFVHLYSQPILRNLSEHFKELLDTWFGDVNTSESITSCDFHTVDDSEIISTLSNITKEKKSVVDHLGRPLEQRKVDPVTLEYMQNIVGEYPKMGEFDLNEVKQSVYFFS